MKTRSSILIFLTLIAFMQISNEVIGQIQTTEELNNKFCENEKEQAKKELQKGHIYYVINFGIGTMLPRYEYELEQVLKSYKVELKINPVSCEIQNDGECYKEYMDSIIVERYGIKFANIINAKADSLFTSKRNEKIYDYWEIDKRPYISKDIINKTGDPFIDYLNLKLDSTTDYKFVSNCINNSHFIIEYTVDSIGKASNCVIVGEEFINNEDRETKEKLRQDVVDIVNSISIWTPGNLNGYNITVREHRGAALKWKNKK